MSIARLESIQDDILNVQNIDILDGTPLLDIKPFIADFDKVENSKSGWMQSSSTAVEQARSDERIR